MNSKVNSRQASDSKWHQMENKQQTDDKYQMENKHQMENKQQGARKYSSKIIADVMASITPLESLQVETRFVLAGRIAGIMDGKRMSNKELAARMKKSPSEISRWLSGTHNFTIDTLSEIAIALEVPVMAFFMPSQPRVVRDVRLTVRSGDIPPDNISFIPVTSTY